MGADPHRRSAVLQLAASIMNASGAGLAGHYRVRVPNLADAAGEQVRVEYEAENGLEVLVAQVQCLAPALLAQELQLVDYAGMLCFQVLRLWCDP